MMTCQDNSNVSHRRRRHRHRSLNGKFCRPTISRCVQLLGLCAFPMACGESGVEIPISDVVDDPPGAIVTLEDLNANFERLASRVEALTHHMEDLLTAAEQEERQLHDAYAKDPPDALAGNEKAPDTLERANAPNAGMDEEEREEGKRSWPIGAWGSEAGWENEDRPWSSWLVIMTFVHEVWVFLQHANILLNPLCQRLDRGYGIALLKRRLYWVIAGVLAAYWAREIVSMCMAAPFASPLTLKMVVVSTVYHVGKISLISLDAKRGWSPTLGIMRLLIDHWHLSSVKDLLLCIKRVMLQAFDTVTHALLVRDMLRWDEESEEEDLELLRTLLIVCAVWAMHAIANLVTRKSTATLVVEVAKGVVGGWGTSRGNKHRRKTSRGGESGEGGFGALDGGSADFVCTANCSHGHKRCEVCHLLTRDQPPSTLRRKRVD